MHEEDELLLGAAVIAGYFILKGAASIPTAIQKVIDIAQVDAGNLVYSDTNTAGNALAAATHSPTITTNTMLANSWGVGVANLTSTAPNPANIYVGGNAWGYGTATMESISSPKQSDWIAGVHLW